MKLQLFMTLWGRKESPADSVSACVQGDFDGIEGKVPKARADRLELAWRLSDAGLGLIAEICTAGSYVPDRQATFTEHVDSFRRDAELALELRPLFLNVILGCDAWTVNQSVDAFGQALAVARKLGVDASFETHRSRSLFNPWIAREILLQLPELQLTCDFSHWCVVCERLIDTEPDVLALCAERARHIHARVGYDQGPQVPHPAAPEYAEALDAHERWWTRIWSSQLSRGFEISTMTPEFGPDGYLHTAPFTGSPVADLTEINSWMAGRQKLRFGEWRVTARSPSPPRRSVPPVTFSSHELARVP